MLGRTDALAGAVHVTIADGSEQALAACAPGHDTARGQWDLVITDIDMGANSLGGFDLTSSLRKLPTAATSLIAISSKRIAATDSQAAIASGAEVWLPKPIGRAQLMRLILQAAARASKPAPAEGAALVKPEVLLVEDNIFISEAWEQKLGGDATVRSVAGIDELRRLIDGDKELLGRLICVVTDLHLDDQGDGVDVGRLVKGLRSELPVLLSSDGFMRPEAYAGAVDRVIAKAPLPLERLLASL